MRSPLVYAETALKGKDGLRKAQVQRLTLCPDSAYFMDEARRDPEMSLVLRNYSALETNTGLNRFGGEALYSIARALDAKSIVETGVGAGVSTSYLLKALWMEGAGRLASIDPDGSCGSVVPERLKKRWEFRQGKSFELLPPLLGNLGQIDLFVHDSEHSYANMMFELEAAWPYIRRGGVLVTDDADANAAFEHFKWKKALRSFDLFAHGLKAVRKP